MEFFSGNHENRLFVLKLKHYGILINRNGYLYDGEILVGRNVLEAVTYVQDTNNNQLVSKWGLALDNKEGRVRTNLTAKAISDAKKNEVKETEEIKEPEKKSGKELKGPVVAK